MDIYNDIEEVLNNIAANIPIIDKSDLTVLTEILVNFEKLSKESGVPRAFLTTSDRGAKLTEKIIMGGTDFDMGCKKLGKCVEKLTKALDGLKSKEEAVSENDNSESDKDMGDTDNSSNPSSEEKAEIDIQDDMRELAVKFAANQNNVLENMEVYTLELEKRNPQAKPELKRILHTLKGEFGVLDLREYSTLVHDVEEGLENGSFTTDNLFKLKDFLEMRLGQFAEGKFYVLEEEERADIFSTDEDALTKVEEQDAVYETGEEVKSGNEEPEKGEESAETDDDKKQNIFQEFSNDSSLVKEFITESREHLAGVEPALLDLENDPSDKEKLNSIFRACHTIKGVAGFLNYKEIAKLSHSLENLMDSARKGDIILDSGYIDLLFEGMDCLKEFISMIEGTLAGEPYKIPDGYKDIRNKLSSPLRDELNNNPIPVSSPDKKIGEILMENNRVTKKEIDAAVKKQKNGDNRKIGEILIKQKSTSARQVGNALAGQSAARAVSKIEETIRVPVTRLDQLIDSIGEAVIAQSMVSADSYIADAENIDLEKKISQCSMILRNIQEISMSLRMVSVKSTFQKMARLVRDLSKKHGKLIEFKMEGENTELDKSVVEHIGDPLIHMIRNAVDHGIEDSEKERTKTGKPAKASVSLRAFHKAGSIYIEVEDDGRGLDKEKIRKKAVQQGLCSEEDKLGDQEIFQFVFAPGFSTAKKVTDISGRGVGMDVVKRNVQALRGSVEINSEKGKGSTFSIRLPLTLAIIDGMVVKLGKERYIIPVLSILESIKPEKSSVNSVLDKGEMLNVRGGFIKVVRLSRLFGHNGVNKNIEDSIVIIVEDMLGKQVAMQVDEILGQQQVVIKSIEKNMGKTPGFSGGAIMSDGNVSLILDIDGIVKMAIEEVYEKIEKKEIIVEKAET